MLRVHVDLEGKGGQWSATDADFSLRAVKSITLSQHSNDQTERYEKRSYNYPLEPEGGIMAAVKQRGGVTANIHEVLGECGVDEVGYCASPVISTRYRSM